MDGTGTSILSDVRLQGMLLWHQPSYQRTFLTPLQKDLGWGRISSLACLGLEELKSRETEVPGFNIVLKMCNAEKQDPDLRRTFEASGNRACGMQLQCMTGQKMWRVHMPPAFRKRKHRNESKGKKEPMRQVDW